MLTQQIQILHMKCWMSLDSGNKILLHTNMNQMITTLKPNTAAFPQHFRLWNLSPAQDLIEKVSSFRLASLGGRQLNFHYIT